jgi:hypothetical protein
MEMIEEYKQIARRAGNRQAAFTAMLNRDVARKMEGKQVLGVTQAMADRFLQQDCEEMITDFDLPVPWVRGALLHRCDWKFMWMMNKKGAEILKRSEMWEADGTFHTAPADYAQLFTFMTFDGRTFTPCAHFLLTNFTAATYEWVFTEILEALDAFEPDVPFMLNRIGTDFEKAIVKGFRLALDKFWKKKVAEAKEKGMSMEELAARYPGIAAGVRFDGCLFHFSQANSRKCQELFPKNQKWEDLPEEESARRKLGWKLLSFFLWLPYYDYDFIVNIFAQLEANEQMKPCENYIKYFRREWI